MKTKKIHMMGVLGSGMSGVFELAKLYGFKVDGCDQKLGGHSVDHLRGSSVLVVSPAVLYQRPLHPETAMAIKKNMFLTWEQFLADYICKGRRVICVAGTHGKSTTTAMIAGILEDAGKDPGCLMGAVNPRWSTNYRYGQGNWFVVEADEFNDNFLHYKPEVIVLNNIEFDHPDFFKDEKQLMESFKNFVLRLIGIKVLIVNGEDLGVQKLIDNNKELFINAGIKIVKFTKNDWLAKNKLSVIGDFNISNAASAIALSKILLIDKSTAINSLISFQGVNRRNQIIYLDNQVKIIDDYAHHPTAIKKTLDAIRSENRLSRIYVVIEPHGYKRTMRLINSYKDAFTSVDEVVFGPIYKARDKKIPDFTPQDIIDLKLKGVKRSSYFEDHFLIMDYLKEKIKKSIFMQKNIVVFMGAGNSSRWAKDLAENLKNHSFKNLTTLKVGGGFKYYFELATKQDIAEKYQFAKKNKLPIFILGGGSDILTSDKFFNGIVFKPINKEVTFDKDSGLVVCGAGLPWDDLVSVVVESGFGGMECLSGIPGTVGAAPVQNIGAYGQELKETFVSLEAFDLQSGKFVTFSKDECRFGYRESIFKDTKNYQRYIIHSVKFKLIRQGSQRLEIKYNSLKDFIDKKGIKNPTLKDIRQAVLEIRSIKLVNPNEIPNAGSFFKNPVVSRLTFDKVKKILPDIQHYADVQGYKLSAAQLIESAGLKGFKYKDASVSSKHSLVLTNPNGKANFKQVSELSLYVQAKVFEKFGIQLEPEVQMVDFDKIKTYY